MFFVPDVSGSPINTSRRYESIIIFFPGFNKISRKKSEPYLEPS